MKRTMMLLAAVMMISTTAPVFAASPSGIENVKQCAVASESIQQKIARLQSMIKEGKKTLKPADLKKLEQKLNDANKFLDQMMSGN